MSDVIEPKAVGALLRGAFPAAPPDVADRLRAEYRAAAAQAAAARVDAREAWDRLVAAGTLDGTERAVESPEDAAERLRVRRQFRVARWSRGLPAKFASFTLDRLDPGTQGGGPGGPVTSWWASGAVGLWLLSPRTSNGKTSAAYAVGSRANADGAWVYATSVVDLARACRPGLGHDPAVMEEAVGCDLLILDDLGADRTTEWSRSDVIGALVDARWREQRRTIVTSNLPYDERGFAELPGEPRSSRVPLPDDEHLCGVYGSRVMERLVDGAVVVRFTAPSFRRPVLC